MRDKLLEMIPSKNSSRDVDKVLFVVMNGVWALQRLYVTK